MVIDESSTTLWGPVWGSSFLELFLNFFGFLPDVTFAVHFKHEYMIIWELVWGSFLEIFFRIFWFLLDFFCISSDFTFAVHYKHEYVRACLGRRGEFPPSDTLGWPSDATRVCLLFSLLQNTSFHTILFYPTRVCPFSKTLHFNP